MRRSLNLNSLHLLTAWAWCVVLNLLSAPVGAQELYPSKPIHLIVTTAAGDRESLRRYQASQRTDLNRALKPSRRSMSAFGGIVLQNSSLRRERVIIESGSTLF
jgi:hypothetical protein